MNIEEKKKRLMELIEKGNSTDKEIAEMNKLEEEIRLGTISSDGPIEEAKQVEQVKILENEVTKETKKQGGLLRKILRVKPKEPPKPVTQIELDQLNMEAKKQEILAKIAKAKAEQYKAKSSGPSIFDSITKVIGKSSNNPFDASPRSSKKRSDYDPFRW